MRDHAGLWIVMMLLALMMTTCKADATDGEDAGEPEVTADGVEVDTESNDTAVEEDSNDTVVQEDTITPDISDDVDASNAGGVVTQTQYDDLLARLNALEPDFCAKTATNFTGDIGGYAGAKAQCEATCSSPTAHMCTATEMVHHT